MILYKNKAFWVLILTFVLNACGGGGGGNNNKSDTAPNAYAFVDQVDIAVSTQIESNTVTIAGIDAAAEISIAGGEYSIDSGAYTNVAGTVDNGQTVQVRQTSSALFSTATDLILTIGGVSDVFTVTTVAAPDTTPDAFLYTDQVSVPLGTIVESNTIVVSGINTAAAISITGGEYSIDSGGYTAVAGTVDNGQAVRVRQISSSAFLTTTDATLDVGGVTDTFSVTTLAEDTVPDAFSFTNQTDVARNTVIESNTITVTGINSAATISVTGGEYSIDSGSYTAVAGTINNNQSIRVRHTSAASGDTATATQLTIGGVSDTFTSTTLTVTSGATISFPPSRSMTEGDSIVVRGTGVDLTNVSVNGVNASSSDGFATWSAAIPLNIGLNTISVEATDISAIVDPMADTAVVDRNSVVLSNPVHIAVDSVTNRAYLLDQGLNAVIQIDLTDNSRFVLSSNSIPDANNTFNLPVGIELDSANNRLLVLNFFDDEILAVDLTTGARTVFSDDTTPNASNQFDQLDSIVLDAANNRALVVDAGLDRVFAVDLTTGVRTVFSSNSIPDNVNPYVIPDGIELDSTNNRALVLDRLNDSVIAVNLTTGARAILSDDSTPNGNNGFVNPEALIVDSTNNRALVADSGNDSIIAVDLTTGERTVFSNDSVPNTSNVFDQKEDIALDANRGRVLVVDQGLDAILPADLSTGARSVVPGFNTPDAANLMSRPVSITVDAANNRLLALDDARGAVFGIDLDSGARTILSDDATPNMSNNFSTFVQAISLDAASNRALVIKWPVIAGPLNDAIIAVDLASGVRQLFSINDPLDTATAFDEPEDVRLDAANSRALVIDSGRNTLFAVDLATGARTVVSSTTVPNGTNPFTVPEGLALDAAGNRVLVIDNNEVLSVDLITGARNVLSDNMTPDNSNPFGILQGISVDAGNNRVLVVEDGDVLKAVDLTTGARTVLSSTSVPNVLNLFQDPEAIAIDTQNNIALVADVQLGAIIAVDLVSGQRVFLSK